MAEKEPKDMNTFFKPIIEELKVLNDEGILNGQYKVHLVFHTADLPAKKKVCYQVILTIILFH